MISPGLFDSCKSKPSDLDCEFAAFRCPHFPSPFIIITQPRADTLYVRTKVAPKVMQILLINVTNITLFVQVCTDFNNVHV